MWRAEYSVGHGRTGNLIILPISPHNPGQEPLQRLELLVSRELGAGRLRRRHDVAGLALFLTPRFELLRDFLRIVGKQARRAAADDCRRLAAFIAECQDWAACTQVFEQLARSRG